jgi:gluconokinase
MTAPKVPKSPYEKTSGIFYFARMLDKIRLFDAHELREDLHANMGTGFDKRCVDFLGVSYDALAAKVRDGLSDEAVLEWAFETGRRPTDEQIEVWNAFLRKVGWNDSLSERLEIRKTEGGFLDRDDIRTFFDYIDADEGRPPAGRECY